MNNNFFRKEDSKYLCACMYNVINFSLSQIEDGGLSGKSEIFLSVYPLSSFICAKIDSVDVLNFLVLFSKHCYCEELAAHIVLFVKQNTISLNETVGQISWVMFYIAKNNRNNIRFILNHPEIQPLANNLYFSVSSFIGLNDHNFMIPFFQFVLLALKKLNPQDESELLKSVISQLDQRQLVSIAAESNKAEVKILILRILHNFLKLNIPIECDYFSIQNIIDIAKNTQNIVMPPMLILISNLIAFLTIDSVALLFRSSFFTSILDAVGTRVNFRLPAKIIFLIYEKLEVDPQLFPEYIMILAENETVSTFLSYLEEYQIKDEKLLYYIERLQNSFLKCE